MRLSAIFATLLAILMNSESFNLRAKRAPAKQPQFRLKEYEGHPSRGVASIYHRAGARKGKYDEYSLTCYGVIIAHEWVVVPCSCVAEPEFANTSVPTPWDHKDPGKVVPISKYDLFVTTMYNEKHVRQSKHYETVNVDEIKLSPKCDTSYQVNIAVLRVERAITFEKLAWIHTSDQMEMVRDTMEIWKANAVTDRCHIFRWVRKPAALTFIHRYRIDGPWMIQKRVVRFQHWHTCMGNVCPIYTPPGQKQGKWILDNCQNLIQGARYCLKWEEDELLCDVIPGTPVFCFIGDFQGVVGMIHNSTVYCPQSYSKNAIMEGFSDALEMISHQLPIHFAPSYRYGYGYRKASDASYVMPPVTSKSITLIVFVLKFLSERCSRFY